MNSLAKFALGQSKHVIHCNDAGKIITWLQRQMDHTTLHMLIRHYWWYMEAHDLRAAEMARLERDATEADSDKSPTILI